jgi:glycosyltransferase involved in cell wall biosynthesis
VDAEPLVTVLTAVRNGAPFLEAMIASVRTQTFADLEHVVVDDASDDETPAILERVSSEEPRLRILRRDVAGGPYIAANEGLREARGRYVARLDADDLCEPARIETQLAFLRTHPGLRACVGGWRYVDERGDQVRRDTMRVFRAGVLPWALCVVPGFVHSTLFAERDVMIETGGYAEVPASADLGMLCALARRRELGSHAEAIVRYRHHETQLTSARADVQTRCAVELLREHLRAITGEQWSDDEAAALHATGRWLDVPLRAGVDALDRFEAAWRRDATLDAADRRELAALTRRVRLRHARRSAEASVDMARALVRTVRPRRTGAA